MSMNEHVEKKLIALVSRSLRQYGVRAVRMDVIAREMNMSKRTLYKVYKTKDNLLNICLEAYADRMRNLFQIMMILNICMQKEACVWTIKDNYRLGADIQSKVMAFAFGLAAEIERDLISQRTKEALRRIKAEGLPIGRKSGCKNKEHILDGRENEVIFLYKEGVPKTRIARRLGVSIRTIYNFLAAAM